jgi:hypothetical protein
MNCKYQGGGAPTRHPPNMTNKPLPQNTCINGNHCAIYTGMHNAKKIIVKPKKIPHNQIKKDWK